MATCTMTETTSISKPSAYSVAPPSNFKPLRKPSHKLTTFTKIYLPLKSLLPTSYKNMYTPDVLENKNMLTRDGRPLFTQRDLIDWTKNDTRSLLIVPELRPEWHGRVPQAIEPGYNVVVLPLDSSDDRIIQTLVQSDIYKEHAFEERFLLQTAQYTVQAARQRCASKTQMTLAEWRNVIENYLLNLACEAQCRDDFKKSCALLKKHKQRELRQQSNSAKMPLLKRAIMTRLSTSPDYKEMNGPVAKVSLSRTEKQQIWVHVQTELYARLGLDWEADELI